jgi:hypothetical protein
VIGQDVRRIAKILCWDWLIDMLKLVDRFYYLKDWFEKVSDVVRNGKHQWVGQAELKDQVD